MIAIEDILVSDDLVDEFFVCDLKVCKGGCCVKGEGGAPLEEDELGILEDVYEKVEPYLTQAGIEAIKKQGHYTQESQGEFKTTLIKEQASGEDGGPCAYVNYDNGVAVCGIEKAYLDGKIDFQKPVSCHLYPVRIQKYDNYDAVNYEKWEICDAACALGKKGKVPLYKFVKEALTRKYGKGFYEALDATAKFQAKEKENNTNQ